MRESIGETNEFSNSAIFELEIGQKSERALADLREQTADTLFSDIGTVAFLIEGETSASLRTLATTARYVRGTKKKEIGD